MKYILKPALFLCLLVLLQIQFAQVLFERGRGLCLLGNLPHRGLGMLYAAHLMFPHREDYTRTYLTEYLLCTTENRLLEGQRRPVMAMWAASKAREFPEDEALKGLYEIAKKEARKKQ